MKKPKRIIMNEEEVESLQAKLAACDLDPSDKKIIVGVLAFYLWLQWALQETKLSLHRLRSLFGLKRTEKRAHLHKNPQTPEDDESEGEVVEGEEKSSQEQDKSELIGSDEINCALDEVVSPEKEILKSRGHGRMGHEAYTGATTTEQLHETLKAKDECPEGCGGRLYLLKPQASVFLTGHALASATRHLRERLRCALCGQVFTAKMKEGTPTQKHDEALRAQIAIAKNYAGLPFYRIEMLQKMVGVPLPDSTQWQLMQELADDINPAYHELVRLAAQGDMVCYDDTGVKILSCIKENKEEPERERKGMYTTGIVARIYNHIPLQLEETLFRI